MKIKGSKIKCVIFMSQPFSQTEHNKKEPLRLLKVRDEVLPTLPVRTRPFCSWPSSLHHDLHPEGALCRSLLSKAVQMGRQELTDSPEPLLLFSRPMQGCIHRSRVRRSVLQF